MVTVAYHDDLNEVQGLAALREAARAPFDRIEWWRALCEECDVLPLFAHARDASGEAFLPMRRVQRRIEGLANWYTFRLSPVFTEGADRAVLLHALAESLIGEAPRITLSHVPDENGEAAALAAAFRKAGWAVFMNQCDVNHVLHVGSRSFAEYLASRPGPLRTTLKRKAGKVAVSLECHFSPESWAAYEAVYAQSWKPQEGAPAMLRRFAEEEGRAGRMRLALARVDGAPVAAQFWTVEGATAWIHKLAHTESAKPLSPGTTLSAALFEQVIDRDGVSLVDFGTGDDGYKHDWMEEVRPRYRLDLLRPGWPGNWPALAKLTASRLAGSARHD